jgi:hypothetical protein
VALPHVQDIRRSRWDPLRIPASSVEDKVAAVATTTMAQSTRPPKHAQALAPALVAAQHPETPQAEEAKGAAVVGALVGPVATLHVEMRGRPSSAGSG